MLLPLLLLLFPIVYSQTTTSCSGSGYQCSDNCGVLGYCNSNTLITLSTCKNTATPYCDATAGQCSSNSSVCNSEQGSVDAICGSTGYFPDPSNCRRYLYCGAVGEVPVVTTCPVAGYGYDPCTEKCNIRLTNNQCNSTGTACTASGTYHVVATNHQLYYSCYLNSNSQLTPLLLSCADNYVFDVNLEVCVLRTGNGCETDTDPSTSCTVTCSGPGVVADPCNCKAYYYCKGSNITPMSRNCNTGYYFSTTTLGCVQGDCQQS